MVSIRSGETRRQAPLKLNQVFWFPSGPSDPFKVDIYQPLGHSTVNVHSLRKGGGDSFRKLKMKDMEIDLKIAKATSDKQDPGSPSPKNAERLNAALRAREYLDDHDLVASLQHMLQDVLRCQPVDPNDYMIEYLKRRKEGKPSNSLDLPPAPAPAQPAPAQPAPAQPTPVQPEPAPAQVEAKPAPLVTVPLDPLAEPEKPEFVMSPSGPGRDEKLEAALEVEAELEAEVEAEKAAERQAELAHAAQASAAAGSPAAPSAADAEMEKEIELELEAELELELEIEVEVEAEREAESRR